jgi:hypothetical protein
MNFINSTAKSSIADLPRSRFVERAGFGQGFQTGVGLHWTTDASFSKLIGFTLPQRERNQQLEQYVLQGAIPLEAVQEATPMIGRKYIDYNALAKRAKEMGLRTETDEDIMERVREDVKFKMARAAKESQHATFGGKAGQLVGMLTAAMIDPIEWPGYFVGVGAAAKGARLLSKVTKAGLTGAGINAYLTTARLPGVLEWKKELQIDHSVKDALMELGISAGAGFALPAAAITFSHILKATARHLSEPAAIAAAKKNAAVAHARDILEQTAREAEEGLKAHDLAASMNAKWDLINKTVEYLKVRGDAIDELGSVKPSTAWDDIKAKEAIRNARKAGLLDEYLDPTPDPTAWDSIKFKEEVLNAQKAGMLGEYKITPESWFDAIEQAVRDMDQPPRSTKPIPTEVLDEVQIDTMAKDILGEPKGAKPKVEGEGAKRSAPSEGAAKPKAEEPPKPKRKLTPAQERAAKQVKEFYKDVVDEVDSDVAVLELFNKCMSGG